VSATEDKKSLEEKMQNDETNKANTSELTEENNTTNDKGKTLFYILLHINDL